MKSRIVWALAAGLAAGFLLLPAGFGNIEHYSAVWQVTRGPAGGASTWIDIWVKKYNSEAEIQEYAQFLVEGGPDKLLSVLENQDLGSISQSGGLGAPIVIARKMADGEKTIIRVISARYMSFAELRHQGRSVDYPYTVLQIELDKNGKGTGTAIAAGKIRFNKKSETYEVESYEFGTEYDRLVDVQRLE